MKKDNSKKVLSLYNKLKTQIEEVDSKIGIDTSSTWQVPFSIKWNITITESGKLKIVRTEQSLSLTTVSGKKRHYKKEVDKWLLWNDFPLKESGKYSEIKSQISFDKKCIKSFKNRYKIDEINIEDYV